MTLSLGLSLVYLVGFFTWMGLHARKTDLGLVLLPIMSFLGTSLFCIVVMYLSAASALMAQHDAPVSALLFANAGFVLTCLIIEFKGKKSPWISRGARAGYWLGTGVMAWCFLMLKGYL